MEEKDLLNRFPEYINLGDEDDRAKRNFISKLRKRNIIYISVGKREYRLIDCCTKEQVEKYINTQIKSMQTQYFNTLKPVKNYMTKEQLDFLHNGGMFDINKNLGD